MNIIIVFLKNILIWNLIAIGNSTWVDIRIGLKSVCQILNFKNLSHISLECIKHNNYAIK